MEYDIILEYWNIRNDINTLLEVQEESFRRDEFDVWLCIKMMEQT